MIERSSLTGWPKFQRSTLWLIILILIPTIALLGRQGEEPVEAQDQHQVRFPLDSLDTQQDNNGDTWLYLPDSGVIAIGLALKALPDSRVKVPNHQDLHTAIRNQRFVVYVTVPAEKAALDVTLDFLQSWLPPLHPSDPLILLGAVTAHTGDYVREKLAEAKGNGLQLNVKAPTALTVIPSPPMGSPQQLTMVLVSQLIAQRTLGYDVQVRWDHQGLQSLVTLNSTLKTEWVKPANEEEFQALKDKLLAAAGQPDRSLEQIQRYLMTVDLYDLTPSFITDQEKRIAAITLDQVNQQLGQIARDNGLQNAM